MKKLFKKTHTSLLLALSAALFIAFGAYANSGADLNSVGLDLGANREITAGSEYDKSLAVKCTNGIFVGKDNDGVISWKGVPFAKPPVGELRFKAPVPPDSGSKIYEAYNYSKKPILTTNGAPNTEQNSEDCLYLNIFTGAGGAKNKPVMVWIHGGSFVSGSTSDIPYRGDTFAKEHPDIILVTVAYRLGFLGFMNLSEIPGGDKFKGSENNGIKDQLEALRWVKKNIAAFGGNPNNITIFGESAGAMSVSALLSCKEAKGLFNKAIIESGTINSGAILSTPESIKAAQYLCEAAGVKNADELQKLDIEKLLENRSALDRDGVALCPVNDGEFIPLDPIEAYSEGLLKGVKVLVGYNKDELRFFLAHTKWNREEETEKSFLPFISRIYDKVSAQMTPEDKEIAENFMAESGESEALAKERLLSELCFGTGARKIAEIASNVTDAYLYFFDFPTFSYLQGAQHGAELPFVFAKTYPGMNTKPKYFNDMYGSIGEVWASFAKTGVPTINGRPAPKYDAKNRSVIVFDAEGRAFTADNYLKYEDNKLASLFKYQMPACIASFIMPTSEFKKYGIGAD
ncbi:MAG: carboxylesterase family protein [Synergistes sp.]|nr:carboxylesterase family protein [Synergistes sp.]